VLADLEEGIVSVEAAREIYGVVLNADGTNIDAAATAERRRG
jgi:N-methylhydantoinase B